jgi:hypothetical protein
MAQKFSLKSILSAAFLLVVLSMQPGYAQYRSSARQLTTKSISSLKYINNFVLPHKQQFKGTTVGGLSSIDYDPYTQTYYLVCDDRSNINPARFYTARIVLSAKGIKNVTITGVHTLLQEDGSPYPKLEKGAKNTTDPEAMRYNGNTRRLTWTSEGERIITNTDTVLIQPTINVASLSGRLEEKFKIPENMKMQLKESGPRQNGVLEGISFGEDFKNLYISMEEPLFQDGPRPALERNKAFTRIYKFDVKTKRNTAQYAYELEPVALPPSKEGAAINNGIPDILWISQDQFLVTERSFSGGPGTNVKVFMATTKNADNIISVASLKKTPAARPVQKKLVLNMDDLGIFIDNVEGATLGPKLPNGHQTVIFAVDDNFAAHEQNQFLLFEVIP